MKTLELQKLKIKSENAAGEGQHLVTLKMCALSNQIHPHFIQSGTAVKVTSFNGI